MISFLGIAFTASWAADPEYSREVRRWKSVTPPPETDEYRLTAWFEAASTLSKSYEWRVFVEHDLVYAQLASEPRPDNKERPKFEPKTEDFSAGPETAFMRVDEGWLVGFNQGEFGAALYWFSRDGKQNYKISDHQVVHFFSSLDGLYAIQGLDHMGYSRGSIIRIARPEAGERWRASTVVELPAAPCTISTRRDGTMFVTSPNSIVAISRDRKSTTLLQNPWWYRPTSAVLSPDQQKLYIGMDYFVGEFDIPEKKLRLLVPSDIFLKPFRESEQRLREYEAKNNMRFYRRPPRK
ncbi:MAG: hypothetical protein DLM73_14880 [Chthoniobacterales bacterium]|nr:MAG: hypothetical protein DLM73_14880 [Chthoniobacterales bacterium]